MREAGLLSPERLNELAGAEPDQPGFRSDHSSGQSGARRQFRQRRSRIRPTPCRFRRSSEPVSRQRSIRRGTAGPAEFDGRGQPPYAGCRGAVALGLRNFRGAVLAAGGRSTRSIRPSRAHSRNMKSTFPRRAELSSTATDSRWPSVFPQIPSRSIRSRFPTAKSPPICWAAFCISTSRCSTAASTWAREEPQRLPVGEAPHRSFETERLKALHLEWVTFNTESQRHYPEGRNRRRMWWAPSTKRKRARRVWSDRSGQRRCTAQPAPSAW